MKRLILGLAAIIFAGAMAAFTTPKSSPGNLDDSYFEFNSAYSYTVANVQDESKWNLVSDMSGCPSGTARACKVRVSPTHVDGSTLKTSADIQATLISGVARISGGNLEDYANQANP